MDDLAGSHSDLTPRVPGRRVSYDVWCQCARLLLGLQEDAGDIRPDLYAAQLTPLAAARMVVFGTPDAGKADRWDCSATTTPVIAQLH